MSPSATTLNHHPLLRPSIGSKLAFHRSQVFGPPSYLQYGNVPRHFWAGAARRCFWFRSGWRRRVKNRIVWVKYAAGTPEPIMLSLLYSTPRKLNDYAVIGKQKLLSWIMCIQLLSIRKQVSLLVAISPNAMTHYDFPTRSHGFDPWILRCLVKDLVYCFLQVSLRLGSQLTREKSSDAEYDDLNTSFSLVDHSSWFYCSTVHM